MKPSRYIYLGLPLTVCLSMPFAHAADNPANSQQVARGAYLVRSMSCVDCHTPLKNGPKGPEPDLSRGLSGHPEGPPLPPPPAASGPWIWGGAGTNTAFWGPWGVSYAANLTPDATGLASWTAEQFVQAMRTGKHAGSGRPIAPPMPWAGVGQLTDIDLRSLFAYLKSQPPVRNTVPANQPPAGTATSKR